MESQELFSIIMDKKFRRAVMINIVTNFLHFHFMFSDYKKEAILFIYYF